MNPNLKVNIQPLTDDYQVYEFSGEFDKAGHSDIKETLDEAVKQFEGRTLVFDFNGLRFINSEGIGYLMEIHTHLINRDKRLIIVGLNANVADVFKTIGINEIIPIYDNLKAFLNK